MSLYDNIKEIAKSKGYSINKLEQELGFARSYISKFKTITPSAEKLRIIADFLDVSVDYLMTGEDSTKAELNARDERDIAKDLENIMRKMKNGENGPASFEGEEIPEEDLELFAGQLELMLRRLKAINKEKYNPYKNKK